MLFGTKYPVFGKYLQRCSLGLFRELGAIDALASQAEVKDNSGMSRKSAIPDMREL